MAFKDKRFYRGQLIRFKTGQEEIAEGIIIGSQEIQAFGAEYIQVSYTANNGSDRTSFVGIEKVFPINDDHYSRSGEDIGISTKGKEELLDIINQDKSAEEILLDLKDHLTN